jgi:hypothetical protein
MEQFGEEGRARKTHQVGDMATEPSLSGENLGTVLESFGGKSLKQIVMVGAAIFGCGLTVAMLIRVLWPDYLVLATVVLGAGVVMALAYMSTSWEAGLAKVEVCEGGVRFSGRGGVTWDLKGYVSHWSGLPRAVELPWNHILKVKVGYFKNVRGRHEHLVLQTTDGKDVAFPFHFWSCVGTERFVGAARRFVDDVEFDVDFFA